MTKTTFDTIEFGGVIDKVQKFIGKKLNRTKAQYVVDQMRAAVADQQSVIKEYDDTNSYNNGWLHGFRVGLTNAEADLQSGVWFFGSKQAYLFTFLSKMEAQFLAEHQSNPSNFNDGACEGYQSWLSMLESARTVYAKVY